MLHELVGINNNRVDLKKTSAEEEIVMSPTEDSFYMQNLMANFGELGIAVKQYVDLYQQESKTKAQVESIDDMQKFVDQYPEFRKLSGNVTKHVGVIHELSRLVDRDELLEVSSVEQELACHADRDEHARAVMAKLTSTRTPPMEKLRLVLLFALRYENDPALRDQREQLRKSGVEEEQVRLVDALLRYGGSSVRNSDLFQNKNLLSMAKNTIQRGLKGTPNVYTQHKSLLASTLEALLKGRLKDSQYPSSSPTPPAGASKPPLVMLFMVGGATYEELRDVESLGEGTVLLGGTTIHNSRSFLADVAQLDRTIGPPHTTVGAHYTAGGLRR
eukprot:GHVS01094051.1.p1 GENE.GHVS01094051.1~~GHVS01094051.1.p1  ORF type:complete len:331 (-),score=60.20 GHVS01094051.1:711-1703(-)